MLNELIPQVVRRFSMRKYAMTPLAPEEIAGLTGFLDTVKTTPFAVGVTVEVLDKAAFDASMRGMFRIAAPHYLVLSGGGDRKSRIDAGYLGELFCLKAAEADIGTCWLGGAKPKEKTEDGYIITIAFGRSTTEVFRTSPGQFKRKALSEMSTGDRERHAGAIERARLSPSGMNAQTCSLIAEGDEIIVMRKKAAFDYLNRLGQVDLGIFVAHILLDGRYRLQSDDDRTEKGCVRELTLVLHEE